MYKSGLKTTKRDEVTETEVTIIIASAPPFFSPENLQAFNELSIMRDILPQRFLQR